LDIEKFGYFLILMMLKPLLMRVGISPNVVCDSFDTEIAMDVTVSKVPWYIDNALENFMLISLDDVYIRLLGASP
jgi:hypothetical protein